MITSSQDIGSLVTAHTKKPNFFLLGASRSGSTTQDIGSLVTAHTKKPNFFLLGAGRCGSTTLYSMLRQHPQIFMPTVKEPSFFCSYFQVVKDPIMYFQLFNQAVDQAAIGEASHVYFSNPESAAVIHALFPQARFILIFRSPTERAHSLYQWMRYANVEPLETFEEGLEAEDFRYSDVDFFRNCPQYFWNFMYVKSSYFNIQWKRYLQFFSRDQFFVLTLKELASDPARWMKEIFEFLEVDTNFTSSLKHLNSRSCSSLLLDTKQRLDRHFQDIVAETNDLACRNLNF